MVSLRPFLKICLSVIVIGSSAVSISKCSNDYMYKSTSYELSATRPSCQDIEQRTRRLKGSNKIHALKYIIGVYGEINALREYGESYCRQQQNLNKQNMNNDYIYKKKARGD